MNTGVITLSAQFTEDYSDELKKNNINVIPLTTENFDHYIERLDAVVIREDAVEDVPRTCSLLLKIRENSDAFVWVFSSNSAGAMKMVYLQLGAVGVLSDDCTVDEFQLIISNSLCRKGKVKEIETIQKEELKVLEEKKADRPAFELISRNFSVKIDGRSEIPLTKLEYKTLELLYRNVNKAVTYQEIFEEVWKQDFDNRNYRVANLIFHIREKIETDSLNPRFVKTVRSKGYLLALTD